jgi:hypothetical protein
MPPPIVNRNLFTLLALELALSAEEVQRKAATDTAGADELADEFEQSPLAVLDLVLAEPIRDRADGTPLIAEGGSLSAKKIRSLLNRYSQSCDVPLAPVVLAATEPVVQYYRKKMLKHFDELSRQVREGAGPAARIIRAVFERALQIGDVGAVLGQAQQALLDAPGALSVLLPLLENSASRTPIREGIVSASVAMAVLSAFQRIDGSGGCDPGRMEMGLAALLQDLSLALDPQAERDSHPARSAEIAQRMGFEGAVVDLVAHHHVGELPPSAAAHDSSPSMRVLVAANTFVQKTIERKGHVFEAVKIMHYLAEAQLLDKSVVQRFAEMFLPRLKSLVLEQADGLRTQCLQPENRPILWPITGDKVPAVYLCQATACDHKSDQVSHLAQEVPFELGGKVVATVKKGTYFTCPFLTERLQQLYGLIQGKIVRDVHNPATAAPNPKGAAAQSASIQPSISVESHKETHRSQ